MIRLFALLSLCSLVALIDVKADWETLRAREKPVNERAEAARSILVRAHAANDCGKAVAELIDFSLKATTPHKLCERLAIEITNCDGEDAGRVVAQRIGQGQPREREFLLHAALGLHTVDIDKAVTAKGLADEEPELRKAALDVLVAHKFAGAVPALEALLKAGKDPDLVPAIVAGITSITKGTDGWDAWEKRLVEMARGTNDAWRRAALVVLAQTKDPAYFDVFVAALANPDWSTRVLALGFLEHSATKPAVTAIVDQMQRETPGSRLFSECRSALERISGGMNLGDRAEDWAAWWRNNEDAFTFKKSGAPSTPDPAPKPRSDTAVAPRFYGIEIESQRVCFVIDISGSMLEPTQSAGDSGAARIDVARRELDKIIGELPRGSLFNIIAFNAQVDPWLDRVGDAPGSGAIRGKAAHRSPSTGEGRAKEKEPEKTEEQKLKDAEEQRKADESLRAKARAWVGKLKASGGTNINDALELAFADPDVDTIFFLTDGQPSVGGRIEPEEIRAAVKTWNATRRVKLHAIAIGTEFPLLKELAADNGGQYSFFP